MSMGSLDWKGTVQHRPTTGCLPRSNLVGPETGLLRDVTSHRARFRVKAVVPTGCDLASWCAQHSSRRSDAGASGRSAVEEPPFPVLVTSALEDLPEQEIAAELALQRAF